MTILCIGGCLDREKIHFRGKVFSTPNFKEQLTNNFEKHYELKTLSEAYDVHIYKIFELFSEKGRKKYQLYIFTEIKDPIGALIEGYKNER